MTGSSSVSVVLINWSRISTLQRNGHRRRKFPNTSDAAWAEVKGRGPSRSPPASRILPVAGRKMLIWLVCSYWHLSTYGFDDADACFNDQ